MCGDHMPLFNKIFPFTMMAVIAGYPPDDQDNKSCQPVTTEVITNDATTTKPEPGFDHQTQPAKGSPAGITNIILIVLVNHLTVYFIVLSHGTYTCYQHSERPLNCGL